MFPSKFLQFPSILTHFHAANEKFQNGGRDLAISRGLVWVKTPYAATETQCVLTFSLAPIKLRRSIAWCNDCIRPLISFSAYIFCLFPPHRSLLATPLSIVPCQFPLCKSPHVARPLPEPLRNYGQLPTYEQISKESWSNCKPSHSGKCISKCWKITTILSSRQCLDGYWFLHNTQKHRRIFNNHSLNIQG